MLALGHAWSHLVSTCVPSNYICNKRCQVVKRVLLLLLIPLLLSLLSADALDHTAHLVIQQSRTGGCRAQGSANAACSHIHVAIAFVPVAPRGLLLGTTPSPTSASLLATSDSLAGPSSLYCPSETSKASPRIGNQTPVQQRQVWHHQILHWAG